jgi:benzylsuccinate CoA-transferase BbsF subunit
VLTPITGYNYLSGYPERVPFGLGTNYPDYVINPGHTLIAILAALHYRNRTGRGQRVECAQLPSSAAPLGPAVFDYTVNGRVQTRAGNRIAHAAPHGAFKCKPLTGSGMPPDERWVAIACFTDDEWRSLVSAMGDPEWASEARFETLEGRKEHEDELEASLSAWTGDKDAYTVMRKLQARGVAAGVVQSAREVLDFDEHLRERGYYRYLEHAETGRAAYDGPPAVLSRTPGELRSPAPLLGEHTEYVCKEILGLSDEVMADLLVEGVLQ